MPTIIINGIPVSNAYRGSIESYFSPQRHLRDLIEAQDVEYEEIYEQEKANENDTDTESMVERP